MLFMNSTFSFKLYHTNENNNARLFIFLFPRKFVLVTGSVISYTFLLHDFNRIGIC